MKIQNLLFRPVDLVEQAPQLLLLQPLQLRVVKVRNVVEVHLGLGSGGPSGDESGLHEGIELAGEKDI